MKTEYYWKKENVLVLRQRAEFDRVTAAVEIRFQKDKIHSVEFYSSMLGVAKVYLASEQKTGNAWESEITAQSQSLPNYHYTGFILNGTVTEEFLNRIIADVHLKLKDAVLEKFLKEESDIDEVSDYIMKKYPRTE